ncbi:hypothetical protein MAPG_10948 [Magnaporthiopsis poae ATCC 64411]|uniref:HNH nuclease domain-containing protein n=1 Tax=Magnaporthiopsis poae (strain ATCC 64411 / 73-15) TaxID=644358 RepID=A0A0C4EDY8_MAGP6|nr:hypothetical protein MAPG_10948 [Magnaporthiopsis poae ATCC 64411]
MVSVPVDDIGNMIVLRRDLHHLFGTRRLVFTAKAAAASWLGPTTSTACLAVHVPGMRGVVVELLFACLAWTLFTDAYMPFFNSSCSSLTTLLLSQDGGTRGRA